MDLMPVIKYVTGLDANPHSSERCKDEDSQFKPSFPQPGSKTKIGK